MHPLPRAADLTSLVLRTDFRDDAAWAVLETAIDGSGRDCATFVSDPAYAGVTIQALVEADAAASDDDALTYVFLADATTMTDGEQRLLAVDLYAEPGRAFRVPPHRFADVATNLSIANMDFAEFADATDESGTYRGFDAN